MVNSGLEGVVAATTRSAMSTASAASWSSPAFRSTSWRRTPPSRRRPGCCGTASCRRRRELDAFRAELAAERGAAAGDARAAARLRARRVDPMDALRIAAGTISLDVGRSPRPIVAQCPDDRRRLLAAAARRRAARAARDLGHAANFLYMLSGETPDAERVRGARDLSQHRRRPRPQRLDVHRARDHLHRIRPGVGGRRRARRAERAAARRRARPGARHGVRDRRRVARRGRAARERSRAARS